MNVPLDLDMKAIRRNARDHVENGAVTKANKTDVSRVIDALNGALATELVCVLRYKNHHFMARGILGRATATEFLEHANEEQAHADSIAERITQLGGRPDFSPAGLAERSHSEYVEGNTLRDMLMEDLVAERIAITTYSKIIRWLGDDDPTTRRLLEQILAVEEEHADDLAQLLEGHTTAQGERNGDKNGDKHHR